MPPKKSPSGNSETAVPTPPIVPILQNQIIPWIREYGMTRVVIARSSMEDLALPRGMTVSPKKRRGRRVGARGGKHGDAPRVISAFWPEDQQIEVRTPQLMCVTEGFSDLHLSDYILHCPQSYFVLIPPGVGKPIGTSEPHLEGASREGGSCDILWFAMHRRWMQTWQCHSRGHQHFNSQIHENVITTNSYPSYLLEALWDGLSSYRRKFDDLYTTLMLGLALSLQRDILEERFFYVTADSSNDSFAESYTELGYDPITHARELISNNLHENLTLENVAQKVYMSRAQFAKRFHEETGQTFTQFATQRRLEQAQQLLRETEYTLAYISRMVGYKSAPHLHNLFERHLKISPLQFRREAKQAAGVNENQRDED